MPIIIFKLKNPTKDRLWYYELRNAEIKRINREVYEIRLPFTDIPEELRRCE